MVHNKLLTYQDKRYRYDAFGRMIEKRSGSRRVQRFSYDTEHRLIEVHNQEGARETVVRMRYDPLGRRIEKTEQDSNGYPLGETRFTWDGLRLLQEHRNSQTSLYLYAEGYEPIARVDGLGALQKVRYYHNDLNGLPEQLTESDGHTLWQARYKVWGNTLEEVREPYYIEEQNLRFQGQYLDREIGLHYNTFRFYDPDIGRFTTPDPIGLTGGINLYHYTPNPLGYIDPLGLAKTSTAKLRSIWEEYTGKKSSYQIHHGLPEELRADFMTLAKLDVNNGEFFYDLPADKHILKPDGVHTKTSPLGQEWNAHWKGWIEKNRGRLSAMGTDKAAKSIKRHLRTIARKAKISKFQSRCGNK